MSKIIRTSELEQVSLKDLPAAYLSLVKNARKAYEGSYSPYSQFAVGAAVLLENNEVILGSNQENAAYPSGLCAERVALFYAGSSFPDVPVKAIAVTVERDIESFPFPCGSFLQVMSEYIITRI